MKITLLGDSIRCIGYGKRVEELLGPEYEVFQPEDNCRFARYTLRCLFDWREAMKGSRIVHFNAGLWDISNLFGDGLFTPEDEYRETMLRIGRILKERYDEVIFATTTPVDPRNEYNRNEDIDRYNALVVPEFQRMGIRINDLSGLIKPHIDAYIRKDDCIHLTEAGIEAAARQVAASIREAAAALD